MSPPLVYRVSIYTPIDGLYTNSLGFRLRLNNDHCSEQCRSWVGHLPPEWILRSAGETPAGTRDRVCYCDASNRKSYQCRERSLVRVAVRLCEYSTEEDVCTMARKMKQK